jgi:hypothetical protein
MVGVVAKIAEKRLISLIAGSRFVSGFVVEPVKGVEPITYGLQNRCSAIELHRRVFSDVRPSHRALAVVQYMSAYAGMSTRLACRVRPFIS